MTKWRNSLIAGAALLSFAAPGLAQDLASGGGGVSCDPGNQCVTGGSCQADGSCAGTPLANGTACDDGNPCTGNDTCQAGECKGGPNLPDGTACTLPFAGACASGGTCMSVPFPGVPSFCVPADFVECDASDPCNPSVCDPRDGQCKRFPVQCDDDCSTARCDPRSGECIDRQPRPDGTSCDDFNQCTANDRCQGGTCRGTGGTTGNTPTSTIGAPSATPTRTNTRDGNTPTATVAARTATRTSTATPSGPTPTPPPLGACFGDCNDDGEITIDELVKAVNIALGSGNVGQCNPIDVNGDGEVTIDELVKAVNAALNGCVRAPTRTATGAATSTATATSASPSRTPTATSSGLPATFTRTIAMTESPEASPTNTATVPAIASATHTPTTPAATNTATSTATPGAEDTETPTPVTGAETAQRAAGLVAASTGVLLRIPEAMAVLSRAAASLPGPIVPPRVGGSGGGGLISVDCPVRGSISIDCAQELQGFPPTFSPPAYSLTATDCQSSAATGQLLTLDGVITVTSTDGAEICFLDFPQSLTVSIPSFTVRQAGSERSTTATLTGISGTGALATNTDSCGYSEIDLSLTGTITAGTTDGQGAVLTSTEATFNQTSLALDILSFTEDCYASFYQLTLNGLVAYARGQTMLSVTYSAFTMQAATDGITDSVEFTGSLSSACFGGSVLLATPEILTIPNADTCPVDGEITTTHGGQTDRILFTQGGGVDIDVGDDGGVDASFPVCYDPSLMMCPG